MRDGEIQLLYIVFGAGDRHGFYLMLVGSSRQCVPLCTFDCSLTIAFGPKGGGAKEHW